MCHHLASQLHRGQGWSRKGLSQGFQWGGLCAADPVRSRPSYGIPIATSPYAPPGHNPPLPEQRQTVSRTKLWTPQAAGPLQHMTF